MILRKTYPAATGRSLTFLIFRLVRKELKHGPEKTAERFLYQQQTSMEDLAHFYYVANTGVHDFKVPHGTGAIPSHAKLRRLRQFLKTKILCSAGSFFQFLVRNSVSILLNNCLWSKIVTNGLTHT